MIMFSMFFPRMKSPQRGVSSAFRTPGHLPTFESDSLGNQKGDRKEPRHHGAAEKSTSLVRFPQGMDGNGIFINIMDHSLIPDLKHQ